MSFNFPNNPQDLDRVENQETGSLYEWRASLGKWVLTTEASLADELIWEGVTEPPAGEGYKLWFNTNDRRIYYEQCDDLGVCEWVATQDILELYVKKEGGDTMEGPLEITGPRSAGSDTDNPNQESTLKVYSIENRNSSYLGLKHNGTTKVYVGEDDISIASDIKFNRGAGSTIKSNVQDLLNINDRKIAYLGQSVEDEDLITKKYVDDTKDILQNEIIELEEEIEALAPSLSRGKWSYNPAGVAGVGQFAMYDSQSAITNDYNLAATIFVNPVDTDGVNHGFSDVVDGSYLEIFDANDNDFGLYQVTDTDDQTAGNSPFWVFTVDFVKSNTSPSTAEGTARFKFFELADAADPGTFLLKTGDTIDDATEIANYTWNSGVSLKGSLNATNSSRLSLLPLEGSLGVGSIDWMKWDQYQVLFPNNYPSDTRVTGLEIEGKTGTGYDGDDVKNYVMNRNLFYVSHYPNEADGIFYNGRITYDTHIATKKYVDDHVGGGSSPIQVLPGNPSNPQVGDAWFSTNQNTFIIKVG